MGPWYHLCGAPWGASPRWVHTAPRWGAPRPACTAWPRGAGTCLCLCHGDQSQRGAPKGRGDPSVPPRCAVGHLLCYGVITPRGPFISIMGISMPWGPPCAMGMSVPWGPISTIGTPLCHGEVHAMGTHLHYGDPSVPWGPISTTGTHLHHWVVHAMGHLLCHGAPSVPRDPPVPMGHPCHGDPSPLWGPICATGTACTPSEP